MSIKTPQKATTKRGGIHFAPEILYPYWREAGGVVQEAMRLAKAAAEKRVPKTAHAWADYGAEFGFAERMRADEKAKWERFHNEREEKQQQVMDSVAHSFEQVMGFLSKDLAKLLADLNSPIPSERRAALSQIRERFGTVAAAN